ncbi:post-segregation antitoxin CcdA [Photorhabdus laumondii subsp. laumondii]|uniref:Photorhabdus luminescens subsp. laumondii TTO1 complete genome segment 8/17 n=2 Tax=Photorhabdus laumondii subsp. laumondii TaxID=141679 RepID=Q7N506_PHOLL|nr:MULTISPECIES: type II toxin-antitoxin system CcdA family antitoxin [Photorhabdus]AXG42806.1 post-segregation antitoxin CcdA [Photorhabdus laumondii subsp. laumondii]AXG47262.1 post-segregation antitoxin CcdA [Photorhabdus laumondii subsp. laumondii]MCC8385479.1 type II toxin-antitoxin system CcdA family antitoxin [Photorhabdus laumondii]MCC8387883.1 type II toxin-antitoxin system CcdA family antitoxin [Photorhabdus laumondii]MCC8415409.1 type II toxin-antitoxin system CcdA family antitoxin 
MRSTIVTRPGAKKGTNVYLTTDLVDAARSLNMNLSATLDELLAQAVEAKKCEQKEDAQSIQVINKFLERAGIITDDEFFGSL